jgi:hypothetical protein
MRCTSAEAFFLGARRMRIARRRADHREGILARTIEHQTAKLPSDIFLWAAVGSIAVALGLQVFSKKAESNFVGQWAPTFLILGLYNKVVKVLGSDYQDRRYR